MANSGFSGADVTQVRALGARMKVQSSKLREIATSSTVALMAAEWTGNDIDAIRNNWRRSSLPTIDRFADILHEMSVELEGQARAQEEVSGGATGGGTGSWLDGIRDWFERTLPNLFVPFLPGGPGHLGDSSPTVPADGDRSATPVAPVVTEPQGNHQVGSVGVGSLQPPYNQDAYNTRGSTGDYNRSNGPGQDYDGQCTSWVNFRRLQLDLPEPVGGHGGQTAFRLGSQSADPSLGAVGSYSEGNYGHTFIVEEIKSGTYPRSFVVSEMNVGEMVDAKRAITTGWGKVSTATYVEVAPGQWQKDGNVGPVRSITFGQ